MEPTPKTSHLRAFLLGTLPAAERHALEDRLAQDDDLFETICALDDDLLDDYRRGVLPSGEARLYSRRLRATRRGHRRLALQSFLDTEAAREIVPPPLSFGAWIRAAPKGPALLAQAALLALVITPLVWHEDPGALPPAAPVSEAVDTAIETPAEARLLPAEATFDLPASNRSTVPHLRLPASLDRIRLRVPIPSEIDSTDSLVATLGADRPLVETTDLVVGGDVLGQWAEVQFNVSDLATGLHAVTIERRHADGATLVGQFPFLIGVETTVSSAP